MSHRHTQHSSPILNLIKSFGGYAFGTDGLTYKHMAMPVGPLCEMFCCGPPDNVPGHVCVCMRACARVEDWEALEQQLQLPTTATRTPTERTRRHRPSHCNVVLHVRSLFPTLSCHFMATRCVMIQTCRILYTQTCSGVSSHRFATDVTQWCGLPYTNYHSKRR